MNYWLDRSRSMEVKIEKMLGVNVIWLDDPAVGREVYPQIAEWDSSWYYEAVTDTASWEMDL